MAELQENYSKLSAEAGIARTQVEAMQTSRPKTAAQRPKTPVGGDSEWPVKISSNHRARLHFRAVKYQSEERCLYMYIFVQEFSCCVDQSDGIMGVP